MVIRSYLFSVTFKIEGHLSKRQRRAIALAIFRKLSPEFSFIGSCWILHDDMGQFHRFPEFERGISMKQAPSFDGIKGKFGFLVRLRRLSLGWTQKELSDQAGLCRTQVSRIERGKHIPHALNIRKLERVLKMKFPDPNVP